MQARKDEIHLSEFGLRVFEDEAAFEDFSQLADIVKDFVACFKGLHLLSILWDGPNAPEAEAISTVLSHHAATLEVYVVAAREDDDDEYMDTTLRFISKPRASTPWTPLLGHKRSKLREFGLDLSDNLATGGYSYLRLLSQFDLRTVHIRNFPALAGVGCWRDGEGIVSQEGQEMAGKMAEYIALPFYALPKEVEEGGEEARALADVFKLQALADIHAAKRDESLGCIKLKSVYSLSAPIRDLSKHILEQRADIDFQFASIMQKVKKKKATAIEQTYYNDYVQRVQSTLGVIPPTDKPKLRLLIVGDWRYRDQMNLSGPRNWDPNAWCTEKGTDIDVSSDLDDDSEMRLASDTDLYGGQQYRLRYGFKKEWDVSLLPIFFKVEWNAVRDEADKKWRWKAEIKALEQTTLEGYGALSDVRSLDFAFQN